MRCATSSPTPTPAPCCPCSEQPPVRERGSPFFLFFREKKEGRFLFFLFFQKKKRKNQRKETLTGRDLRENFRAALPAALCVSGEGSVLSFPSGKERKNQRKETLSGRGMNGNHRAALPRKETLTGRDLHENFRAALPAAFVSRLSGGRPGLRYPFSPAGLFFQKSPAKYSLQMNARAADGRAQRASPSGFPAFFSGSLFFLLKEKRTKQNRTNET